MDFEPTDRCKEILEQVRDFMAEHVYPVEDEVIEAIDREVDVDTPFPAVLVDLRARAKAAGSSAPTASPCPPSLTLAISYPLRRC